MTEPTTTEFGAGGWGLMRCIERAYNRSSRTKRQREKIDRRGREIGGCQGDLLWSHRFWCTRRYQVGEWVRVEEERVDQGLSNRTACSLLRLGNSLGRSRAGWGLFGYTVYSPTSLSFLPPSPKCRLPVSSTGVFYILYSHIS